MIGRAEFAGWIGTDSRQQAARRIARHAIRIDGSREHAEMMAMV